MGFSKTYEVVFRNGTKIVIDADRVELKSYCFFSTYIYYSFYKDGDRIALVDKNDVLYLRFIND